MRPQLIRLSSGLVALALVASAPSVLAGEADALPPSVANAMAQASPQAIMEYRRKLQEYQEARAAFEQDASAYWGAIADKRRGRNAKRRDRVQITLDDYVLQQPPVYEGPKRPVNPAPEEEGGKPPRPTKTLPVAADLVRAAAEHFQFAPQRPTSEVEFKRAYARYARAAGLTPEQAVRVYSFETGGTGNYDVQAGIEHGGKRAISTAMGYNQLLTTNTVELLAEQGHEFVRDLTERVARTQGPARKAMEHKLAVLKKMVAFTRTVPDDWSAHARLADTPQGWACHAMVLDIDVGPMLQTHKLLTSVIFARNKGYNRPLTAAELEMMNLTGDGTGLDMVTMPQAMREQVPTANFFQRSGYERNPVAIRHNTVARLLAVTNERMDVNSNKPGARELAAAF
ncbi:MULTISPECIES: hypothetical protein [Bradyrhizobium]|jgi:hypothetical protein|uniref:hypothetical protein n=1 Tax=Bradyrhizobium TaxID=374 RepID=UPI0004270420|nr:MULTISPECIES: hypothetical protein [Bradyrhizobium]KIU47207.1 hypothetical protein QU41_18820 [Bradyrhizobium elkanii]MBK5655007.1 hypothetical protein [Rhizobium sp.]OCX31737.1 hypothetical protein QU42_07995 [Bradyrhizobium sp. UASWS1016]